MKQFSGKQYSFSKKTSSRYPFIKKPPQAIDGTLKHGFGDTFTLIRKEHPHLLQHLLNDLLHVEGYTEVEIAFGLNVPLHIVREIINGEYKNSTRKIFRAIIGLYARVFCHGFEFRED